MQCYRGQLAWKAFMHLAYIDDSGSDRDNPIVVVGAAIIEDMWFQNIEAMHATTIELLNLPPEKLETFNEFHAVDLYHGHRAFFEIPDKLRFGAITKLLG